MIDGSVADVDSSEILTAREVAETNAVKRSNGFVHGPKRNPSDNTVADWVNFKEWVFIWELDSF